jgi:site-specific DNA recombinase
MYQGFNNIEKKKEEKQMIKNYKDYSDDISRILNYLRRSRQDVEREKRTGEDTLAAQKKLMMNVLDSYGIPYVQKEEIGSGDKISTRPVFMEVIEELKADKYDAIAVKEISRLGRGSYSDMGVIYDLLKDKRLYVITPYRIYDCTNESDLKQIRFELFMSREEFETTRERLTTARYNAALEGKWMGNIPFGYKRNESTMRLEPHEEEAKIIKMIYDLYINGYEGEEVRDKAIATILKNNGIRTAKNCKDWDATQVKRYLTNDAYIGVAKFRTSKRNSDGKIEKRPEEEHIIVEEAHEPIISPEDFEKAQEIRRNKKRPSKRRDAGEYALTGVLTCSGCGRKMVMNRYKRKRLSGDYFDTYVKCNVGGCNQAKYEFVEEAILEMMKRMKEFDNEYLLKLYTDQVKKEESKELGLTQDAIQQQMKSELEKRKKAAMDKLDFIMEKHFDGTYDDAKFKHFEAKINAELDEIKMLESNGMQESAATSEAEIEFDPEIPRNNLIKIIDVYESDITEDEKNELLRNMFCTVKLDVIKAGTKKEKPEMKFDVVLKHRFWEDKL